MAKSKIFTIFMVLILAQAAFCKSVDTSNSEESSEEGSPQEFLMAIFGMGMIGMFQEYSEKCVNISRDILKDQDFLTHHEPMIVEFKRNLTQFVTAAEANNDMDKFFDITDMFDNTTKYYYEIPEDKHTPESKYIVEVLDKYHYKDIEKEMDKEFNPFAKNIMKLSEVVKNDVDKPVKD